MSEKNSVTLSEYLETRTGVILFWAGVGAPSGAYDLLGHSDFDFADRRGLLKLSGTVDGQDTWQWDGEGSPHDDRRNSITKIVAYCDLKRWEEIEQE